MTRRLAALGPAQPPTSPALPVGRLRAVHRATAELRRGAPVLLDGPTRLVILAAETVGPRGLEELAALSPGPPMLLLAPVRAAAVLHRPVEQAGAGDRASAAARHARPRRLAQPGRSRRRADTRRSGRRRSRRRHTPRRLCRWSSSPDCCRQCWPHPSDPALRRSAERAGVLRVDAADILSYPSRGRGRSAHVGRSGGAARGRRTPASSRFDRGGGSNIWPSWSERPEQREAPLVRLHSECFTGDLLGSLRCDCGAQLQGAIRRMADEGAGVCCIWRRKGAASAW